MSLSSLSLSRPVLAIVLNIVIVLFGVIGYNFLGVREYPSIDPPIITVKTSYTGANSEVIESQITEPLEKTINGIAGIKTLTSSSNQGSSTITVEFELSVDLEAAANDVRDKVSQATRMLPQDIDAPPVVSKADANSDAIISMTVQSNTRSQLEVSDYATNVLLDRLQTIPFVSSVQVWGEKQYAMRIMLDSRKITARGLTLSDIVAALGKENLELPSGKLVGDNTELTLNTKAKYTQVSDFENMVVATKDGAQIKLKDIARVELGPQNEETILKESGIPMVALALVPQPGSNYIEIADEFYKRYEVIKKEVPDDIKLDIALDSTEFVQKSILEVKETLIIAFLLVILIIYLFFRDWLIALRPLIDIPVSLVATFFIMYLMGFTINVLTLLGIVLATGLVVDDGIVVTENIFKKLEQGKSPMQAAREGTDEIYFAVIATSITLAVVFLPIIFLPGFVGRLFKEFGIVIASAVLISAFVSLTLTPVLNVKLARSHNKRSRFYNATEGFFKAMDLRYGYSLRSFVSFKWLSIGLVVICFGIIVFIGGNLKSELSPLEDRGNFRLSVTAPEGTSYSAMDKYVDNINQLMIDSVPDKLIVLSVTAPGFSGSGAPNTAFVRVRLKDAKDRELSQQKIVDDLQQDLSNLNMGKIFAIQEATISSGGRRGGLPISLVIQNTDLEKIKNAIPKIQEEMSKDNTFLMSDVDLKFNKPELDIQINRQKAAELGVSAQEITSTLQLAFSNMRVSYFNMRGKQYEVIARVDNNQRDEVLDLSSLYVRSNTGEMIQLENLISVEEISTSPQIYHYNRYKSATISAALAPGKTVGEGNERIKAIADKVLDESFTTSFTGNSKDYEDSSSNTSFAFLFALVLVYLVLAAQFESFKSPFIIMITVPLALAGGVLTLWLFGQTLNIFSQIGLIMLLGLVTKNGILIVEFANQLREQGKSVKQAAIEAGISRLRPILMTSLATILGALPIAIALGAGSESRKPLGLVVVGGLLFSLILTLYIIPSIYVLFNKEKLKTGHEIEHK